MNVALIAAAMNAHRAGGTWRAECPACRYETRDTLSIMPGRHGRVRAKCFTCDDQAEIDAALARAGAGESIALRDDPSQAAKEAAGRARGRERAASTWNGAAALQDDPAARYLIRRGLSSLCQSDAVRWREDVSHPGGGGRRYFALLAAVHRRGEMIAIQRTYLTRNGHKAPLDPPRAALGDIWAGAIYIDPPAAEMVIGEGLETSASAGVILGLPALAAISAKNLERGLVLPGLVRSVIIAADHDQAGITAAEGAARRWQAEGRKVRIIKPYEAGLDFNDILVRSSSQGADYGR